ncbi:MAG: O-antigen ligase family protein [Sediminibacterium sp.]|nr:O-antigen ligase family protein [Sediminibacterium sp.]
MNTPPLSFRVQSILFVLFFLFAGLTALLSFEWRWMLLPFAVLLGYAWLPAFFIPSRTLFWLLCIAIPFSTEWSITPSLGIDFPDEPLMIFMSAGAVVYFLIIPSRFPAILLQSNLFTLIVVQLIWIAITCIYAQEPVLSVKYLLAKIWYVIPFVILPVLFIRSPQHWKIWAACWMIPMLILVLQVIVRHGLHDFSFYSIRKAMAPFFRNHVNYSALVCLLLPAAFASWYLTPPGTKLRKILLIGLGIGIAGWVLAYSRGAWVALPCAMLMVWIVKRKWIFPVLMVTVCSLLISISWLITDRHYLKFIPDHDATYFHTEFQQHMQATFEGKDVSTAERWHRWVAGFRMIAAEPITGFGPNSFYLQYKPYTLQRFQTWVSNNPEHSTVHNYFLLVALEQGVIGLLLLLVLICGVFIRLQQYYHQLQSRFFRTITLVVSATLTIVLVLNFMSDLIEADKVGPIFYSCLAATILLRQQITQEKSFLA